VWIPNKTGVEARIMGVGYKTIDSLLNQPVFIFRGVGITGRWTDNCDLLWWEYALAEGVLTVPLLEATLMLHRKTDQKTETVKAQNRSKPIALSPIKSLMIAQNHDPRLDAERQ
jgi:hypothetical protein